MTSKSNIPTSPYTAKRRVDFRNYIMQGILSGESQPKFNSPLALADVTEGQALTFLGGTTTQEPKLTYGCHHDLWALVHGTRLLQVYAVYGNKDDIGISRKGKNRSYGLSPALTEARQRATDMGIVAYSVLEAHAGLEFTDQTLYAEGADQPMQVQLALLEVEETVLREALSRNRLLQGFLAMCALVSSSRINREQERAVQACQTAVQEPKQFTRLISLIGANAACNRTMAPSQEYVRNIISQASANTAT